MKRRLALLSCLAVALAGFAVLPAFAQEACMNEGKAAANSYQGDADLAATAQQVKQVQQAGLDPNHYLVEYNGGYTLLTMKLHALAEKSAASIESSSCDHGMMPFRKMADVKMIYGHYGLDSMLPPNMAKTDYYSVVGGAKMPEGGMMPMDTVFGVMTLPIPAEMMKIMRQPYCIFGACS